MRSPQGIVLHLSPPLSPPAGDANPPPPQLNSWRPYANAGDFNANLAMILIILISALVCALAFNAAIRYLLRHSRLPNPTTLSETGESPTPKANQSSVTVGPTLVFSSGMKLAGTEAECSICLSEFVNGEEITVLPRCKHGFHAKCIHHWLSLHASCPTCRTGCLDTSQHQQSDGNEVGVESQQPQRVSDLEQPPQPQH